MSTPSGPISVLLKPLLRALPQPLLVLLQRIATTLGALVLLIGLYRLVSFVYTYFLRPSSLSRYTRPNNGAWALVTGASDGIGLGFATSLAQHGFNVVLHGRNAAKLGAAAEKLKQTYPKCQFKIAVADATGSGNTGVDGVVEVVKGLPGPLTVLVNNVGGAQMIVPSYKALQDMSAADVDGVLNMNLRFATQLTRSVLPILASNTPSLILNSGSASTVGFPFIAVYAATKAYLDVWTTSLAREMLCLGLDIECLCVNIGKVTGTTHNSSPPTLFEPNGLTMAKASLGCVGCGKRCVPGYWPHAVQLALMHNLPTFLLDTIITDMTMDLKLKAEKAA